MNTKIQEIDDVDAIEGFRTLLMSLKNNENGDCGSQSIHEGLKVHIENFFQVMTMTPIGIYKNLEEAKINQESASPLFTKKSLVFLFKEIIEEIDRTDLEYFDFLAIALLGEE